MTALRSLSRRLMRALSSLRSAGVGSCGTRAQACRVSQVLPEGCSYSTSKMGMTALMRGSQLLQAHREIDGLHVLGQRADGDPVDARFGQLAHRVQRDPAGDLKDGP